MEKKIRCLDERIGGIMSEPKACPFCGIEPKLVSLVTPVSYFYRCPNCGLGNELQGFDRDEARRFWNTRPVEDVLRAEVERLQEERRWIPVSERLPEDNKYVLLMTTKNDLPHIGWHNSIISQWSTTDTFYYHDINYSEVTHWMPLPEPPEEK